MVQEKYFSNLWISGRKSTFPYPQFFPKPCSNLPPKNGLSNHWLGPMLPPKKSAKNSAPCGRATWKRVYDVWFRAARDQTRWPLTRAMDRGQSFDFYKTALMTSNGKSPELQSCCMPHFWAIFKPILYMFSSYQEVTSFFKWNQNSKYLVSINSSWPTD